MSNLNLPETIRFARQVTFGPWGNRSQKSLSQGRVLIVGCGGLGSWTAELLVRAGVGFLRIVDSDIVELTNIHRQALYGEADAIDRRSKVEAAANRLRNLSSLCEINAVPELIDRFNIGRLAQDVDVILDGTDNFTTRFLLNDYCVKNSLPWVFAGVVRSEAQTMTVLPDKTPCLRCVMDSPPSACLDPNCLEAGVLGPAVSAVASFQAIEVMKLLAGHHEAISPYLFKMDLWGNTIQRIRMSGPIESPPCRCCVQKEYQYLEP